MLVSCGLKISDQQRGAIALPSDACQWPAMHVQTMGFMLGRRFNKLRYIIYTYIYIRTHRSSEDMILPAVVPSTMPCVCWPVQWTPYAHPTSNFLYSYAGKACRLVLKASSPLKVYLFSAA